MRGFTLPVKLLIVAIALSSFILISCVPAPLKPLRIGTNVWPGYEPLFLARELGYYGKTPIQLVEYPNFDPNRAYRNGEVEMSATPMTGFLPLAPTHPDVRAWLIMDISNGADAIVAKPALANLQSLKGRRVGFDRSMLAPFVLSRGLEQVGLSLKDVKIVPVELSEQEEAFKQGRVDAIVTFEPYRSNILNAGAKLLFDSSQIPGEVVDVLIGSESLLTTHATQLQVLIQGWFRALDYIEKNPEDAARRMARRQGITPEQFLSSLKGLQLVTLEENQKLLGKTNSVLLKGTQRLSQFLVENNILKQDVDLNPLLDDRLVRDVKP
ncbi:ABC transporter substrate-binding protein [Trichocoleus sp. Lan]|uniref:ABC transporter substrate-binding protein n=1 Tax=Trichocoleus sp. Lan TaxID=2933927 RepID=UPI003299688B